LNPINRTSGRILESPLTVEPENGYASQAERAAAESTQSTRVVWLRQLWEGRRLLWRFTVYGLLLSLLVSFLLPRRYESRTRLMPPDQQAGSGIAILAALAGRGSGSSMSSSSSGGLGGALGSVAGDLLGLKSSGALFVDMLEGPVIQDSVIQKFDLRKVYGDRYYEDARKDLWKHTDVKEDRKSGVITIAVTDRDRHRAQGMAQAYVDALNDLVARVSTSSARRERMFLEGRLKSVKQNLDNASQEFSAFASQTGALDVPSQTKAMVENEASLQGQLVAGESELEGLRQIYTDNNIRVRTLEARVAALKQQVEALSGNKADLNSDQSQIAGDFPSIRKLPLVGVRWANLYRENKIQETVYELLVQEYEIAKIQEAKEIPTVNVLDPAMVPEKISFPPRIPITVLGTLFACFLASTVIIGSQAWKQNQSAEKQLATEIWAQVTAPDSKTRIVAHHLWSKLSGRNGSSPDKAA